MARRRDRREEQDDTDPMWSGVVVLAGIGGIVLVVLLAGLLFKTDDTGTAVVGAAGGVIGSVVGAFFGIKLGAQGRDKAERRADEKADDAAKGRALAGEAMRRRDRARRNAETAALAQGLTAAQADQTAADPDLEALADMATDLFG